MDIQAVASQLMGFLSENPELVSQFVQHPYSTTAEATGSDATISKDDMSQIVTQVAAQTTGQNISSSDVSGIASTLLGQNGGSVHALTSALFGGASGDTSSMAEVAIKSALGGVIARGTAELLTNALGLKQSKK